MLEPDPGAIVNVWLIQATVGSKLENDLPLI